MERISMPSRRRSSRPLRGKFSPSPSFIVSNSLTTHNINLICDSRRVCWCLTPRCSTVPFSMLIIYLIYISRMPLYSVFWALIGFHLWLQALHEMESFFIMNDYYHLLNITYSFKLLLFDIPIFAYTCENP